MQKSQGVLMMRSIHVGHIVQTAFWSQLPKLLSKGSIPCQGHWHYVLTFLHCQFRNRWLLPGPHSTHPTWVWQNPLTIFFSICLGPGWSNNQSKFLEKETLSGVGCFLVAWFVASSMPSKCWLQMLHCTNRLMISWRPKVYSSHMTASHSRVPP